MKTKADFLASNIAVISVDVCVLRFIIRMLVLCTVYFELFVFCAQVLYLRLLLP
jgi:hypothetical protein